MFRKSLDTLSELGARQDVLRALGEMGRSVFAQGNDSEAEHILYKSFRIAAKTHETHMASEAIVGLVSLPAFKRPVTTLPTCAPNWRRN